MDRRSFIGQANSSSTRFSRGAENRAAHARTSVPGPCASTRPLSAQSLRPTPTPTLCSDLRHRAKPPDSITPARAPVREGGHFPSPPKVERRDRADLRFRGMDLPNSLGPDFHPRRRTLDVQGPTRGVAADADAPGVGTFYSESSRTTTLHPQLFPCRGRIVTGRGKQCSFYCKNLLYSTQK